jgi:hypothetical protein
MPLCMPTCFLGSSLRFRRHLRIPQRPLAAAHSIHRQTSRGSSPLRKAAGISRGRPTHLTAAAAPAGASMHQTDSEQGVTPSTHSAACRGLDKHQRNITLATHCLEASSPPGKSPPCMLNNLDPTHQPSHPPAHPHPHTLSWSAHLAAACTLSTSAAAGSGFLPPVSSPLAAISARLAASSSRAAASAWP